MKEMATLWGGRFDSRPDSLMMRFNASIDVDRRLYREDIDGSIAHSRMLCSIGVLTETERDTLLSGLAEVRRDIEEGRLQLSEDHEDIHSAVELSLREKIGALAGKLHTARSRNDQVATDFRLYLLRVRPRIIGRLLTLIQVLTDKAQSVGQSVMPGYTHLQHGQPVLYGHYLLAYVSMLRRDVARLEDLESRLSQLPLGAGALAGVPYKVDRQRVADELGFRSIMENSIDAVAARDFAIELLADLAIIAMNISRFSEEVILFSSAEFGFYQLPDEWSTGSSIMPNKKNPDVSELVRGKCGRVYGELVTLLTTMKGLPLAYNKDMQEDKRPVFTAVDEVMDCLQMTTGLMGAMKINGDRMLAAAAEGYMEATGLADYLAQKGVPFRDCHEIAGKAVRLCEERGCRLRDLSEEDLHGLHEQLKTDVYTHLTPEGAVAEKCSFGGTSYQSLEYQLREVTNYLEQKQREYEVIG